MLRLLNAKVTENSGARLKLEVVDGFGKYSVDDAFIVAPAGQAKAQVWAAPSTGDQVLAIIDDVRPDLVYCLGAIWPDGKAPSITDPDQILLQAPGGVTLAGSEGAQAIPRDDHVQAELDKIKTMLDDVKEMFNTHVHVTPAGPAEATKTLITAAYTKGTTATDKVKGI